MFQIKDLDKYCSEDANVTKATIDTRGVGYAMDLKKTFVAPWKGHHGAAIIEIQVFFDGQVRRGH